MKQNPSIMFHGLLNHISNRYLRCNQVVFLTAYCGFLVAFASGNGRAAEPTPAPRASFDPAKGFKPAQSDLTEVFLQIAASLEYYGGPEPYLRHMKAEHERIEAKYRKQLGKEPQSFCPAYMDAAYFDRFSTNWKHIAPQLGLESLAKNTGRLMRLAINGTDGKGTMLMDVFNQHQRGVYAAMTGKQTVQVPNFDALEASMLKCLRLNETTSPAGNLTADQLAAAKPAHDIQAAFLKVFSALDAGLSATDSEKVKTAIRSILTDVSRMAQSELEAGIVEDSLDEFLIPKTPYTADQEGALNSEERRTFGAFLQKARFTRDDFSALDKFYSTAYDKLSKRGKLEMHYRIQAGMRPAR